jgi:hypothetical protein
VTANEILRLFASKDIVLDEQVRCLFCLAPSSQRVANFQRGIRTRTPFRLYFLCAGAVFPTRFCHPFARTVIANVGVGGWRSARDAATGTIHQLSSTLTAPLCCFAQEVNDVMAEIDQTMMGHVCLGEFLDYVNRLRILYDGTGYTLTLDDDGMLVRTL